MHVQDALDMLATIGELVGRSAAELEAKAEGFEAATGMRSYGHIDGLSVLQVRRPASLTLYVRDGHVVLAYSHEMRVRAPALIKRLGKPEADWRSRAGKRSLHHVYAAKGLAFSSEPAGDRITIVERFEPCSLEQYAATFYEDPGRFSE
jgi:hypothetical protein